MHAFAICVHCHRHHMCPPSHHTGTIPCTYNHCIPPPPATTTMHTIHVQPLYHVHSNTTTTTAQVAMHAFRTCTTALGKRPPPPPPSHSASYNIASNHHYHHHHHSTSCNACIQYMRHCFRKKTTTTTITQCKLQYCVQSPLPPPPPQHKLQCMHSVYAPLL